MTRDGSRAQQERYFAEVIAGAVLHELAFLSADRLHDRELSLEQAVESGGLSFRDEPFILLKPNVGGAGGE
jgi:hypothetical protein